MVKARINKLARHDQIDITDKESYAQLTIFDYCAQAFSGMTEQILESLQRTKCFPVDEFDYPDKHGIYAFALVGDSDLGDFGKKGTVVYIGIAKKSLRERDLNQHIKSGQTGRSTLRRSIGAILKDTLALTAIPRGPKSDSKRFSNYRFMTEHESRLTDWMIRNLGVSYWTAPENLTYPELRDFEEQITIELRPTLDLDARTKRNNPLGQRLCELRQRCVDESKRFA